MEKQLAEKGREVSSYVEEHNIQVRGATSSSKKDDEDKKSGGAAAGVLVSAASHDAAPEKAEEAS